MPQPESTPLLLRIVVCVTVGCALVTGWLQPLYEMFVAEGKVYVPRWWSLLQIASLAILMVLSLLLTKRHRRLCVVSWCAFCVSLLPNFMPGYIR